MHWCPFVRSCIIHLKSFLDQRITSENFYLTVQYSRDKARYFSARFHASVAGAGTADRDLMRLTVSRCETDLDNIKSAYQTVYGESLRSVVSVSILNDIMRKKLKNIYRLICFIYFS